MSDDHHRRREHQGPRDRLPGAELAGEQPALGVPDGGGEDGAEQQQVGPVQTAEPAALHRGEAHRRDGADARPWSRTTVGGRSCPRSTAVTAVAAGSSAMTTAPWLAEAVVSAYDVSSGNPATTPPATTASRAHCAPRGSRCRVAARATAASTAATTARPDPMKSGCIPPSTAIRVNGTVKEKASTPSSPHAEAGPRHR